MPVFVSFLLGDALFHICRFFPLTSVLILISASFYLHLKRRLKLLPIVFTGIIYALLRFSPQAPPQDISSRVLSITGTFSPAVNVTSSGKAFRTFNIEAATDPDTGKGVEKLAGRKVDIFQDIGTDPDMRYELLLRTSGNAAGLNPGGWTGYHIHGTIIAARETGRAKGSLLNELMKRRDGLSGYIRGRFEGDAGGLVSAVTTGEKNSLSREGKEAFAVTGLAHLLSISGTHFGLFSVILFGIFLFLVRHLPYRVLERLTIYLTPPQTAALLCIPFMLMYLGISGGKVPALRSFIMISLFLAGLIMGRKGFWLNSLFFAAFLLVLWDPSVILSLSFQLSFVAVLFIGFAVEKEDEDEEQESETEHEGPRIVGFLRSSARITLAAFLGTVPLAAYHFHLFPAIAPLSNLLVAPLIGFVLVPLSLFSAFSFLLTGCYVFAPVVGGVANLSVTLVKNIAKIPFAGLAVPSFPPVLCIFFYAGFLLFILMGKRKEFLIVPFIPFLVYAIAGGLAERELSVTFLDVGQGDSAVVELPDGKTLVIDTGSTGRETAAFLKYMGKGEIDALVLTHIHPDHAGGFGYLMDRFPVREIWDNGHIGYPEGMEALHRILERGDSVVTDRYSVIVFHPHGRFYPSGGSEYDSENNSSLVLKVAGKQCSFLFAGDVEEEAEGDLVHLGKWLKSDVIKVPHHGSDTSAGEEFLSLVSPAVAVIPVGKDNPFGHPGKRALARLSGSRILRTDLDGAVKITETGEGPRVKTWRDFTLREARDIDTEFRNLKLLFSTW